MLKQARVFGNIGNQMLANEQMTGTVEHQATLLRGRLCLLDP
jgi:hypothetical protein